MEPLSVFLLCLVLILLAVALTAITLLLVPTCRFRVPLGKAVILVHKRDDRIRVLEGDNANESGVATHWVNPLYWDVLLWSPEEDVMVTRKRPMACFQCCNFRMSPYWDLDQEHSENVSFRASTRDLIPLQGYVTYKYRTRDMELYYRAHQKCYWDILGARIRNAMVQIIPQHTHAACTIAATDACLAEYLDAPDFKRFEQQHGLERTECHVAMLVPFEALQPQRPRGQLLPETDSDEGEGELM